MIEGHDYTIYSNGPSGRARMYAFLALITAFLTPLAQHGGLALLRRYWRDDWDFARAALFFGGFTALILYGVLINVFDGYLWRMGIGAWMFRLIGTSAPPDLNGEYRGTIELYSATGQGPCSAPITSCASRRPGSRSACSSSGNPRPAAWCGSTVTWRASASG
jgi:hypothetical protein